MLHRILFLALSALLVLSFSLFPSNARAEDPDIGPFSEQDTCFCDLDGDGVDEEISVKWIDGPYDEPVICVVIRDASGEELEYPTEILDLTAFYVADLNPDDGLCEVLVSGDVMSSDYYTWVLRLEGGKIVSLPYADREAEEFFDVTPGSVSRIEDGAMVLTTKIDVLGSWWGDRPHVLTEDNSSIHAAEGSAWTFEYDYADPDVWERCLELNRALPYTDANGGEGTLPPAMRLQIIETDGETYARFHAEDGCEGRFEIEPSTKGWGCMIDGLDEEEWFVVLPYAG